ncbi:DEAD/DEAH box helicase [Nonomuraea basaltis]|uniref:DEAD/DEAH box helicase n=1 Tax=Nonomuraea basaltis TaxID=2495887 RepID=UPI00110C4623|nr:DEAD/DEAH box helicase [Nonomuraea basaltis]TMS00608.1 DEAD/DEAH box helicase [Nonomuraea basaltis]
MTMNETGGEATFADLGLRPELLQVLSALGYEEPTPIQREAIPPLVEGRDLLGQAATGTGKTAAFALPVLQRMAGPGAAGPVTLVLVPTRELAIQVSEAFHRYGREMGARVLPIYGGAPIGRQLQALKRGVDVVVATPGRALDHIGRGTLDLESLRTVVLDEADEMLDMGFADDIEAILASTPEDRQTVLFSATLPPRIDGIARRHLNDPVRIEMGHKAAEGGQTTPLVEQSAYLVARAHKPAALGRLLDIEAPAAAIVFCRTRDEVDQLTETMNGRGHRAEALHGGMDQEQRDRVMSRVRGGTADLLIATDVAARGLDIEQLTHVVNYNVPSAPEAYVHRIGRVGRAGREGVALTLAEPREHRMLKAIERVTGQRISVERLPTVADLQARRMELTRAALEECLLQDDLGPFHVVVESLTDEFDLMEVALAAVKLAHESSGAALDEQEIPEVAPRTVDKGRGRREAGPGRERAARAPAGGMARLFFSLGRSAGIRPQDLVGAIAGESSLSGRDIGAIEIADRFSLVEVPQDAADEVIAALRRTTIKGRRPTVRRERDMRERR